jgi:polyphosphate kinase
MGINREDYINRDLSWLSFNARVLQEAEDKDVPLLERLRFLGIFSNNLDEFFRVRVATIRRMKKFGKRGRQIVGADPKKLLENIQEIIVQQQEKFDKLYAEIVNELKKESIFILDETKLNRVQQEFVRDYFIKTVSTYIIPIMIDTSPKFPYLKDRMSYLAIRIIKKKKEDKTKYSLIEVPTDVLPRFIVLPSSENKKCIIFLEDIIRFCLKDIFSVFSYDSIDSYAIKMIRDAELDIDTDVSKSLMEKISKGVKQRKKGDPVHIIYDKNIPKELLNFILRKINHLDSEYLIPGGKYHNFRDLVNFPRIGRKELWNQTIAPVVHPALKDQPSTLNAIKKKDILLAYPYHTFNHIIDVLREAAIDPKVISIKITLYRVANNSSIVNALINAVKNGKNVTAVVELQARFDEETNIYYANKLQEEGVTVIFGVPGLKVHSKLFLITRQEKEKIVQYAHIGTGNFNENTALIYCDHALLTANKQITSEVDKLFGFYLNNYKAGTYKQLIVSPFNTRRRFIQQISNEIKNAKDGKPAWMIIKMNSFVDKEVIQKLYEASNAGVKIKMIVRGICSLVPGIKNKSENIEVISIIDSYLEHSRIFIFCNGGNNKFYLSSGDWMYRNLDFRSEVSVPIIDLDLQNEIKKYISMQLRDNRKARLVNSTKGENAYVESGSGRPFRAQIEIHKWYLIGLSAQMSVNKWFVAGKDSKEETLPKTALVSSR